MSVLRSIILAAADSPRMQRFVQRYGFRLGAARFVAGETLDEAVPVLRRLNQEGLLTNTTRLRDAGHDNVGTVLQSYLFRSEDDLAALLPLAPNLRIVKGAYLEPAEIAYPQKSDVDAAYASLVETSLEGAGFTAVATHDETLIERTIAFARERGIPNERFQFQMLYGVRPRLQLDLVARGHDVLVATPYGPDWYRYLMRRLAERPANLLFFLRSLVRG
jgi:proline dehydrogenase